MDVAFLLDHPAESSFLAWGGRAWTYAWLARAVDAWTRALDGHGVRAGEPVAVESDYSPETVALLLALLARDAVAVPLPRAAPEAAKAEARALAHVRHAARIDAEDRATFGGAGADGEAELPPLLAELRRRGHPGYVLFTSGSSGAPKAVVHDAEALLARFREPHPRLDLLAILVFDHLGGLNTLFHALATGGMLCAVPDRAPDTVCAAIARHRIEVLPASPTFLRLLLLSGAHERHDLSSLRLITYGAEAMPQATLERLHHAFPGVRLKQTYGLIEVGAFPSRSRAPDSLWVRLDVEHRVRGGVLQLRTPAAMLGYLNAPAPFTEDGWFVTGDLVEEEDGWLRFLGRASERITVGGEKLFPQEVEGVIQEVAGVRDVLVYGEPNALVGATVCALVQVGDETDGPTVAREVRRHCRDRLPRHQVPVKVRTTVEPLATARGKKRRLAPTPASAEG